MFHGGGDEATFLGGLTHAGHRHRLLQPSALYPHSLCGATRRIKILNYSWTIILCSSQLLTMNSKDLRVTGVGTCTPD